jgi:hypothetical protein
MKKHSRCCILLDNILNETAMEKQQKLIYLGGIFRVFVNDPEVHKNMHSIKKWPRPSKE